MTLCIYCGQRPATDKEHVVAKVFYITPPKVGVTVPSCVECNRKRGDEGDRDIHLDEEYMRNVLCIAKGTQDHPIATKLSETKVLRSFRRSVGLTKMIHRATRLTPFKSEGGIFEPYSSPYFFPDWARIQRVLRKITKGLYFWSTDTRLPDEYAILVNPAVRPEELPGLIDQLKNIGEFGPRPLDEYDVFRFMVAAEKGETARLHWLMTFYDWAVFHTWTLPQEEVTPGDTGLHSTTDLEIFL
jgi:hypothetical protein